MTGGNDSTRRGARDRWFLFLFVFLTYALTSSGDLVGDSATRWLVAERVAHHGAIDLPEGASRLVAQGPDGKLYSWYGPGQVACLVPFVLGEDVMATAPVLAPRR